MITMGKKGFTHESTYNESKEWYTPRYIFDALGLEFDLDPCSPGRNIVPWIPARHHYTCLDNGLNAHWEGRIFMNPPYGMDTPKWFQHLAAVYQCGCGHGIALVFARTDTRWFHEFIPLADAICFVKGRIGFVPAKKDEVDYPKLYAERKWEPKGGCGAASMLVAFGKDNAEALFRSGLGLALPVSKHLETVVPGNGSRVISSVRNGRPSGDNDNPPQNAESGQSLFESKSIQL
jgi:hypothetical protein